MSYAVAEEPAAGHRDNVQELKVESDGEATEGP